MSHPAYPACYCITAIINVLSLNSDDVLGVSDQADPGDGEPSWMDSGNIIPFN